MLNELSRQHLICIKLIERIALMMSRPWLHAVLPTLPYNHKLSIRQRIAAKRLVKLIAAYPELSAAFARTRRRGKSRQK